MIYYILQDIRTNVVRKENSSYYFNLDTPIGTTKYNDRLLYVSNNENERDKKYNELVVEQAIKDKASNGQLEIVHTLSAELFSEIETKLINGSNGAESMFINAQTNILRFAMELDTEITETSKATFSELLKFASNHFNKAFEAITKLAGWDITISHDQWILNMVAYYKTKYQAPTG